MVWNECDNLYNWFEGSYVYLNMHEPFLKILCTAQSLTWYSYIDDLVRGNQKNIMKALSLLQKCKMYNL